MSSPPAELQSPSIENFLATVLPLPLLRGKNEKALISFRSAEFDDIDALKQGLQTFLFEGHISCYSTVRGPHKLLLNSPRAGHFTKCDCFRKCFCQINKFSFVILFFLIGKMSTRAGWNGFAGQIWPAGRSLVTPGLDQKCLSLSHLDQKGLKLSLQTRKRVF